MLSGGLKTQNSTHSYIYYILSKSLLDRNSLLHTIIVLLQYKYKYKYKYKYSIQVPDNTSTHGGTSGPGLQDE